MATINVFDKDSNTVALEKPLAPGRAAAASSRPVALSTEDKAALDLQATAANQTTGNTSLATIATNTTGAATAAKQDTGNTSLATIATNTTGAATAANQTTGNTSLGSIDTKLSSQATAANQTTGNTSLATIATNTTGAATAANQTTANTSLSSIDGKLTRTATYVDKSGTITSGGAAQTVAALNASRGGFCIQNLSSGDLWLSSLGTAAASQPSIWLPAGSLFEFPQTGVPTTAVSIYGATTGQAFSAREW